MKWVEMVRFGLKRGTVADNTPDYRASYTDSFVHAFDDKGRVTVPSEWREAPFENRLVIFRSSSPCLRVYPASWFSRLVERTAELKSTDPTRAQLETLAASAQNAAFDQQGRMMVKESFRRAAALTLKKPTVLVGSSDHFQIWDKAAWESRQPAPVNLEDALRAMGL
jgi:MraZ protein